MHVLLTHWQYLDVITNALMFWFIVACGVRVDILSSLSRDERRIRRNKTRDCRTSQVLLVPSCPTTIQDS